MSALRIVPVPSHGTEDVLVGPDGTVFTGTADGNLYAVDPAEGSARLIGTTGGRPLGIELLDERRLLVCDAHHGLLAVDIATGELETLVDAVDGMPLVFCNNAAVASNGDIWFSDSSTKFGIEHWRKDFIQNTRTGRLIRRTAAGEVEIVLDDLAFSNGVALSADESYVAVAETTTRTVVRLWLTGPKAGRREFLCHDLPGYPDNIARGTDGLIWVSLPSTVDTVGERVLRMPQAVRALVSAVPPALQPKVKRVVRVMAFDDDGRCVHDLTADATGFHMVTGVREHHGQVWLGSLEEPAVAVISLAAD
ncbi:SMP-30/gluconolactonase/LRE family protein [Nocardioides marmorisolisilvae]|uniref:SMP-30/gluconolactonase/LRE family protein n=1 Tax=Nocardioides marmorisolisilvae TaxID=1542737 RepID=A0A3N0DVE0_9ACTN|nr:SMP-30/gluconolactonase/LRE family protein [Nocardioides marmorisolisilvae]RNL79585.1 SMP-30/gluconolactonase/LRE family protein [Nocardioides marmorisolisilvae]